MATSWIKMIGLSEDDEEGVMFFNKSLRSAPGYNDIVR